MIDESVLGECIPIYTPCSEESISTKSTDHHLTPVSLRARYIGFQEIMGVSNHPAIRFGFSMLNIPTSELGDPPFMETSNLWLAKSQGECWVHPAYDTPKGRRPWDSMPEFLGELFAPEKEHGPPLKWSFYEETQFSSHFLVP